MTVLCETSFFWQASYYSKPVSGRVKLISFLGRLDCSRGAQESPNTVKVVIYDNVTVRNFYSQTIRVGIK